MRRFVAPVLAPVLAAAVLAGCTPQPIVLNPPAAAPQGIEGRYRGTARLVRGDRFCPRSGPRVYQLSGGAVTLSYSNGGRARVPLTARVEGGGAFSTNDGVGSLSGQLSNGQLEMTITSPQCEHRWTMRKV